MGRARGCACEVNPLQDWLWRRFLTFLSPRVLADADERWAGRGLGLGWRRVLLPSVSRRDAESERFALGSLAHLLTVVAGTLVQDAKQLTPASVYRNDEDGWRIGVRRLVATVRADLEADLPVRRKISQALARAAYAEVWRSGDPDLVPFEPLLEFHELGPGLSIYGALLLGVEAVLLAVGQHPRGWVRANGSWNVQAVRTMVQARLAQAHGLWGPPDAVDPTDVAQLRAYLLAVLRTADAQRHAHKQPIDAVAATARDRAYQRLVDWLMDDWPEAASPLTDQARWAIRFLVVVNACNVGEGVPSKLMDGAAPVGTIHTILRILAAQAAAEPPRQWEYWHQVASTWDDVSVELPTFGRRCVGASHNCFFAEATCVRDYHHRLAGLRGAGFHIAAKDAAGRQLYPRYPGSWSLDAWVRS